MTDSWGKHAAEIFNRTPKTHNCAQSVAEGCGRPDLVPALSSFGGGRAPEGRCGALCAALTLIPEVFHAEMEREFSACSGSAYCREIRNGGGFPCAACVATAAHLVEKFQKKD